MKIRITGAISLIIAAFAALSFKTDHADNAYQAYYKTLLQNFEDQQKKLIETIKTSDLKTEKGISALKENIYSARLGLKSIDFWLRYLEPVSYKKINGPLPVEWETEVFEKYEKPYRREGAGLTLAELSLDEAPVSRDSLLHLIMSSRKATGSFGRDSILQLLDGCDHFFFCNRLFLLDLAAIYTTGFECPSTDKVIPELYEMMLSVKNIYAFYNQSFPSKQLPGNYLTLYSGALDFVKNQPQQPEKFDHFVFVRDYVNPLFALNQQLIAQFDVHSRSFMDYSLNKNTTSIFSKALYTGQATKGVYLRASDKELSLIEHLGKLLFYDPILSGNNKRSCASCHKPDEYFTDTTVAAALQFDRQKALGRNSPSLLNAPFNHLLMLDGKHLSLQEQAIGVMTHPLEMAGSEKEIVDKVMSCREYRSGFKSLLKLTPAENKVTIAHIASAIIYYYSQFSRSYSPFDIAMNDRKPVTPQIQHGFNLFMSKAQCGTCHFVPHFNGVKPPYIGSEFEVLGVPSDTAYSALSADSGRYKINPAPETLRAFRTGTLRNSAKTKPYMHNGVFNTLEAVIDFYDTGGGAGRELQVPNQTLSADSLHLSKEEKKDLAAFLGSLNEVIEPGLPPEKLPASKQKQLNSRKVGGEY